MVLMIVDVVINNLNQAIDKNNTITSLFFILHLYNFFIRSN